MDIKGRVTTVRKIAQEELLAMADPDVRDKVANLFQDAVGVVVFECLDMWSPQLGSRTFMCYGPGRTYQTIEEIAQGHLGDLPSQRQYPVAYAVLP